ncbi:MAG: arabinofuranan 3-O-arabinosyltransferase, partial [Actinomycetota bacterium]|nr:arabinofuranan 3-O-arabinosyltransferase [Actinomycetota bacterium]
GVCVAGDVTAAARRDPLAVTLCGPALRLASGQHELRTAHGGVSGLDLDRLVLTSSVTGGAIAAPAPGSTPGAAPDASVKVVTSGRASMTVDVDAKSPVWLVLGQSYTKGWTASGLGAPKLVDGFANGWYVPPTGGHARRITLTFTPQRTVNVMLVLSLIGALLCVALLLLSRPVDAVGVKPIPVLVAPWSPVGARPRVGTIAAVALGGGAVAALLVQPLVGVGIAVALVIGVMRARGPGILAGTAVGSLGLAALFTIAKQYRNHFPPDFGWPGFFHPAHVLAWLGLLLLSSSLAAAAVRRRARAPDA